MSLLAILLTVVFVVLKIIGIITWSWLWVTVPLWGVAVLCFAFAFFVYGIYRLRKWYFWRGV